MTKHGQQVVSRRSRIRLASTFNIVQKSCIHWMMLNPSLITKDSENQQTREIKKTEFKSL